MEPYGRRIRAQLIPDADHFASAKQTEKAVGASRKRNIKQRISVVKTLQNAPLDYITAVAVAWNDG